MIKKFNLIRNVVSNEVSLCSKYNSGANKQTCFEIIKDKDSEILDLKPMVKYWLEECVLPEKCPESITEFLDEYLEDETNSMFYSLLTNGLLGQIDMIRHNDNASKSEKEAKYIMLFNEFISLYDKLPITKTEDNKYIVSLSVDSHIKEHTENPQNETADITKEKTGTMEEQKTVIAKAIELLSDVIGLTKSEAPVDEPLEEETVEEVEEPTEEKPVEESAEAETPNVEDKVEEEVESEELTEEIEEKAETPTEEEAKEEVEEPVEEQKEELTEEPADEEAKEEVEEPVEKTSQENEMEELIKAKLAVEQELAELKKAKEESDLRIEKASYVQKAKDEYSMLVGTPEEIGEKLYSISKSNLDESSKEFVLEQLKKVAVQNEEMTKEVGSVTKNAGNLTDEEVIYQKAQDLASSKGISINKALREIK